MVYRGYKLVKVAVNKKRTPREKEVRKPGRLLMHVSC